MIPSIIGSILFYRYMYPVYAILHCITLYYIVLYYILEHTQINWQYNLVLNHNNNSLQPINIQQSMATNRQLCGEAQDRAIMFSFCQPNSNGNTTHHGIYNYQTNIEALPLENGETGHALAINGRNSTAQSPCLGSDSSPSFLKMSLQWSPVPRMLKYDSNSQQQNNQEGYAHSNNNNNNNSSNNSNDNNKRQSSSLQSSKIMQILTEGPLTQISNKMSHRKQGNKTGDSQQSQGHYTARPRTAQTKQNQHWIINNNNNNNNNNNHNNNTQDSNRKAQSGISRRINWEVYEMDNLMRIVDGLYERAVNTKIQYHVQRQLNNKTNHNHNHSHDNNNDNYNQDSLHKHQQQQCQQIQHQLFDKKAQTEKDGMVIKNNGKPQNKVIQIGKLRDIFSKRETQSIVKQDEPALQHALAHPHSYYCTMLEQSMHDKMLQSTQRVSIDVLPEDEHEQCKQDEPEERIDKKQSRESASSSYSMSAVKFDDYKFQDTIKQTQSKQINECIIKQEPCSPVSLLNIYTTSQYTKILQSKPKPKAIPLSQTKEKIYPVAISTPPQTQADLSQIINVGKVNNNGNNKVKVVKQQRKGEASTGPKAVYEEILSQYSTAKLLAISKNQYRSASQKKDRMIQVTACTANKKQRQGTQVSKNNDRKEYRSLDKAHRVDVKQSTPTKNQSKQKQNNEQKQKPVNKYGICFINNEPILAGLGSTANKTNGSTKLAGSSKKK